MSCVSEKKDISPPSIRRICPRICVKSKSLMDTANSALNGAICSRKMIKCLMRKSCPSTGVDFDATERAAAAILSAHSDTASCANPANVLISTQRYSLDKHVSVRSSGGYQFLMSPSESPPDDFACSARTSLAGKSKSAAVAR